LASEIDAEMGCLKGTGNIERFFFVGGLAVSILFISRKRLQAKYL